MSGKDSIGGYIWAAGAVVVLILGVVRLEMSRAPAGGDKLGAIANVAGGCFPTVDIPTTSTVELGSFKSFANAADAPGNGDPVLRISATGPVEVRLSAPIAKEGASMPLQGQTFVLKKGSGSFEMALEGAPALVRRINALLKVEPGARFGAVEDAVYEIKAKTSDAAAVVSGGKEIIPAGTMITKIPLDGVWAAVPLQPIAGAVWLKNPPASLSPLRVSGQPGLSDLSVDTGRPSLRIGQGESSFFACALDAEGENTKPDKGSWMAAAITPQSSNAGSFGRMSIAIPAAALPADTQFSAPVWIAIGTSDGQSVAVGGVQFIGRYYAGVIATVLTGVLLLAISSARAQRIVPKDGQDTPLWSGLFLNPDGDPSLSLLQILIWTGITIWGFFYVFIVAGNLLALTPEMMSLLGIAGVGTVASRWIASANGSMSATIGRKSQNDLDGKDAGSAFWRMLSTSGHFDLLKLQLFAFTVVIAIYVVWRIADAAAFPVLDTNTLLLLGVSQGVYVTGKLAWTTDLSDVQATKAQLDTNAEALANATKERAADDASLQVLNTKAGRTTDEDAQVKKLTDAIADLDKQIAGLNDKAKSLSADYDAGLDKLKLKP